MTQSTTKDCSTEEQLQTIGVALAERLRANTLITLTGELGAGKSVLARAIIQALGYSGRVKSPTYTLIESYQLEDTTRCIQSIAHLDLYRLADPEELHYLGFEDVLDEHDLVIIEWPEKGAGLIPEPQLRVHIDYAPAGGRTVHLQAVTTCYDLMRV